MNYPKEPENKIAHREKYDRMYSIVSKMYDGFVKLVPLWRRWISKTLPYIQGPDVLEVSFGTGYLLTQFADQYNTFGLDYNWNLTCVARENLADVGKSAILTQGLIEEMPYKEGTFDTVVNTMAFSGYPDGEAAMRELYRVLKPGGRLVLMDINYPADRNRSGMLQARFWMLVGDILRDYEELFAKTGFEYEDFEVGGSGSVHLYLAIKPAE